jgi:5-methylcytosine-specific restriction endonuclease McrA
MRYRARVGRRTRQRILQVLETDSTFEPAELQGEPVWVGKCIHCNARLVVRADGTPIGEVTVEHIVPRRRGGSDEAENLALACARCNYQKGYRHDVSRRPSARAREIEAALLDRRRRRWRDRADRGRDGP